MDPARLLEAARELLSEHGPATAEELAGRLADAGVEGPDDAEVLRRFLLGWDELPGVDDLDEDDLPRDLWFDDEPWTAFPLHDGRLADLAAVLEGLTLTHRLTDAEIAEEALDDDPDLAALQWLPRDGRTLPLAAGGTATYRRVDRPGPALDGPAGWLPDAPIVVARAVGGAVELSGADAVPAPDPALVEAVIASYERLRPGRDFAEVPEIALEVRARHPELLASPGAPIGDVLEAAGLRSDRHRVLYADEPAPVPGQRQLVEHLREAHGFDDAAVDALLTLVRAVVAAEHAMTGDGDRTDADRTDADRADADLAELGEERLGEVAAATLPLLLSRQDHAVALVDDVLGASPLTALLLGLMLRTVERDLPDRRARANWHWVTARVGEFLADDHTVCERHLRDAIELDPHQAQAVFDLVGYRSLRGQAGAALGLLRRLDGPGYDHLYDLLGRYAEPGPTSAGRNDPCPCGSGRKHKACCEPHNGWPLADRIDWVWAKVAEYLVAPFTAAEVEVIADLAGTDADVHPMQELVVANLLLFDAGLLGEFLQERGALLPADELEMLRGWETAAGRAYEVVDVDADAARTELLDLLSGDRVTVVDRGTAGAVTTGDRILAWIAPDGHGGEPELVNGALKVPTHAVDDLLDAIGDPEAMAAWYGRLHAPPVPVTPEGDPIEPTTITYRVADPAAARTALATEFEEDGRGGFVAHVPHDADAAVDVDIDADADADDEEGFASVAGSVDLDGDVLSVHAISYARAEAIAAAVEDLLPDAEYLDEEVVDLSDALAGVRDAPWAEEEDSAGLDLDALGDDEREQLTAALDGYMRRQEDEWVDTPIPALGGATPREAVDDPTRRDDLLRLLAELDEMTAAWEGPGRAMDAGRLRKLLGIT